MMWGVRAYQDWRKNKLAQNCSYDKDVTDANLEDLTTVTKQNLENALCIFIAEVTKVCGEDFPGKTLYQLSVSIQKYLNESGLMWKLVDGRDFKQFRIVLDNVMKERAQQNISMTVRKAEFIPISFENKLWEKGILGEDNPDKLCDTVLFLIGINCGLRAVEEHHDLWRDAPGKPSQFSFKRNETGKRCLVYEEDMVTKTNDGGLASMRKERKISWVYPNKDINRCPVRLVDKYISLCPAASSKTKPNFCLRSLEKTNPAQWYSTRVVGVNTLHKVVSSMLKSAKLDGFFTNHSLRRSGTTHLFQAGVDRKIVKEYTGHRSDAVDQYQITSNEQKRQVVPLFVVKVTVLIRKLALVPMVMKVS